MDDKTNDENADKNTDHANTHAENTYAHDDYRININNNDETHTYFAYTNDNTYLIQPPNDSNTEDKVRDKNDNDYDTDVLDGYDSYYE